MLEAAPDQTTEISMPPALYGSVRRLAHLINRAYWRVEVHGPRVPEHGPVVLAPVHRSFIDFFVVSEVTRRPIFFMAKDELWDSRPLGRFLDSAGAFPVNREGADRSSVGRAQAVLEAGQVLVLFPEGTRRTGEEIAQLHEGPAFLAARTGAAIVPIGIGGTDRSLPKGSKVPRPVHVHLVLGEALLPERRPPGARTPRREVHELTERLRVALQRVYDQARAEVPSDGSRAGR